MVNLGFLKSIFSGTDMDEISVGELKEIIDGDGDILLLDVRQPFEQYQSKIDNDDSKLIPLGELQNRVDELEDYKEKEIVCYCRSGSRSARACKFLSKSGFHKVKNLKGGINEWARKIDNSLPVY